MTSWLGISLAVVALGQPADKIDTTGFDDFRALFCPMAAGDALGSPRAVATGFRTSASVSGWGMAVPFR
ncbi:MAG: hypothetical protein ACC645_18625 [Pirellulales bacterium]